ncbi:hypothetical protein, variant [Puccinia striiformis f. sp. tritici PST-78]|uniref:Uncharacterized protein n=1 Tax=Puccinia striiformis f. sp. tritici PST-78 TaxID=1165861 RepID=A0A0L0USX7_9BASI|nr:hypothetical protein, variant [Puccinia striiformis f. sp. tritici PST-78]
MTNWMQLFGVTLILVNCCITSSSAAHVAGKSPDDGELARAPESQSRLKTRRMMMGLGSEMSWGTPDFRAGSDTPINFKRALSSRTLGSDLGVPKRQQSTSGNEAESFRDSVIVLKNHKRDEGKPASSATSATASSASKPASFRDSVIVLRNHKRSEVKPTASSATSATVSSASESASFRDSVIVLKNHKRSEGKPTSSATSATVSSASQSDSFRDSVIVLKNHVRPEGHSESGAASGNTASKAGSFRDSVIVLKNHRRSEGEDTREQDIITNSESK